VVAYAAVQDPQGRRIIVSKTLGIDKKDVTCHVTLRRWRLRTKIEAGLRRRGRASLKETGQACQKLPGAGRRPALRLLSQCRGHVHESDDR